MTTTLLMMTLMFGQTNVGLDSEAAARRLVGADAPAAQGYAAPSTQASRLSLYAERSQLVERMPNLAAPIVMVAMSPVAGGLGALMWAAFAALDGFRSGWGLILSIPAFVFAVIFSGGAVALATVGSILMSRRAHEISIAEARIGEIDEQLRTHWPATQRPAALSR